jgi:hypothetical protein
MCFSCGKLAYPLQTKQKLNTRKMKKITVVFCLLSLASVAFGQDVDVSGSPEVKVSPGAALYWANTTFDFGKTKVGIPVSYEFRFTNTGMTPLVISSVKPSCGCTVTAYTKDPVEKGASGFVRATYDAGKVGKFTKTVAVYANTPDGVTQLTIKGEITQAAVPAQ